ncbi:hypothetical protein PMKS-000873 [Pichia membranifaciens]|uniref:GH18 domain-containing protein n=1 Tax=Pichia membranifaciens TaxID=4926 RepID=A0A1Q2YCV3_9ASCO|nr:hypothetical protein PMKS-000873 [Pichia membranifaciens]
MQPRQPLAVKSTNVQRSRSTSPLKRAESPTKKSVFTSSPTKKARSSPEKRELSSTPTLKHPSIQEQPFTIFQDSTYARNESASKSPTSSPRHIIPIFQDAHLSDKENGPDNSLDTQSENKENIHITTPCISPLSQRQSIHARKALTDLNINTFPGYIHEGPLKPLMQFQQLREPWSTNSFSNSVKPGKRLMVPSYVTPPKRNRVQDRYEEVLEWKEDIDAHRSEINVILSIGGATGIFPSPHLSAENEADRLERLLCQLDIHMIDLDIEGEILTSREKVCRWIKVIQLLTKRRRLWISLTLPVEFEGGLSSEALIAIKSFEEANVNISLINLMLMDFYTPLDAPTWGDKHLEILAVVYKQLKRFRYLTHGGDDLWKKIGICPMIGENDDGTKFTVDDFDKVLRFAKMKNIGLVTFWAINRDQKTRFLKSASVDTHSKCQNIDSAYTNHAVEILKCTRNQK